MRILFLLIAVFCAHISSADAPAFDQELAIGAGRAYIDSYLRWRPVSPQPKLDSTKTTLEFVPSANGDFRGWVGVFVPDSAGYGGGFAVFHVGTLHPGYLLLEGWGYTPGLKDGITRFKEAAAAGKNPIAFLP
jgi:hypothetical protein